MWYPVCESGQQVTNPEGDAARRLGRATPGGASAAMPTWTRVEDNRAIYRGADGAYWANLTGLSPAEQALLGPALEPTRPTVEAGTGGGRLLLELQRRGFTSLTGFDYLPAQIERAKARDRSGRIRFDVEDATRLSYPDASFAQALYLQQVLSLVETDAGRRAALAEAFRILESGGTALFSFLCLEARVGSPLSRAYVAYLGWLRRLRGSRRPAQEMPWLRVGGRFNLASLADRGPYVYWYRLHEAERLLRGAGFEVLRIGSERHVRAGTMAPTASALEGAPGGGLYVVCRKPPP
jgi:SAM-dependent methyltransferase